MRTGIPLFPRPLVEIRADDLGAILAAQTTRPAVHHSELDRLGASAAATARSPGVSQPRRTTSGGAGALAPAPPSAVPVYDTVMVWSKPLELGTSTSDTST